MENSFIGLAVVVVIVGFVAWQVFFKKKDSVAESTPAPAPAPAPKPTPAPAKPKAPSKAELSKLSKKALDEKAADLGIKLDARKTKDAMIKDFQSGFKNLK